MDFLKRYQIKLTVRSPVFIGSGMTMGKKEYVYDRTRHKVKIPDLPSMFSGIEKLGLMKHFEEYMLESREDLYKWLSRVGIFPNVYNQWIRYELDAGDAVMRDKSKKEIHLFIKDPMGLPYIPGSSMKGALRTALLTKDILQDNHRKTTIIDSVRKAKYSEENKHLGKEAQMMEAGTFMKLKRKKDEPSDPINDYMAAVRISDSKPLQLDDLVLCQKIDLNLSGETKSMPLIRECLKPGTVVEFDLTIDTSLYDFSIEMLLDAIKENYSLQYDVFVRPFKGKKAHSPYGCYVGGGSGFVSKTNVYPVFGKEPGVEMVSRIIDQTLPKRQKEQHKHYKDKQLGVSPHMMKMTKYNGSLYEMGLCDVEIVKY